MTMHRARSSAGTTRSAVARSGRIDSPAPAALSGKKDEMPGETFSLQPGAVVTVGEALSLSRQA